MLRNTLYRGLADNSARPHHREPAAGYLHPAIWEALGAADAVIPVIVALILLTAILRGSNETCERVFRLLRWIANRPEPPAPPQLRAPRRQKALP